MSTGHLRVLENPERNEHKYFSNRRLLRLADEKWLHEATHLPKKHWSCKGERERTRSGRRPAVPSSSP